MFSVSPAELVTIGVIALLVFGPKRLPEIARKLGKIIRDLRQAAQDLKSGMEEEYRDVVEPLSEAGREMRAAMGDLGQAAPTPRPEPAREPTRSQETDDTETPEASGKVEETGEDEE